MKILFIFLLIIYIILFIPIKVNVEYIGNNEMIIRLKLYEIFIIPFKYYLKETIMPKHIRKFLLSIKDNKDEFLKEMTCKKEFFYGIISHLTINNANVILYTDKAYLVSSYYFLINLLSSLGTKYLYSVDKENYQVKFDIKEHIYINVTVSIKIYQIIKEFFKNIKNIKYIFGRRLNSGKSNQ